MLVAPHHYLLACLVLTLAAVAVYAVADHLRRRRLAAIASAQQMHFSPGDRFNLAVDVARRFAEPGAADPKIADLLYCRRDDNLYYVFRFEYTIGTTGPRLRRRVIAGFTEPRSRSAAEPSALIIAPQERSVESQYLFVLQALPADSAPAVAPANAAF